ncbi:hypothetical protein FDUTEX481_08496 [Tolypothrix sp. PCC 7601]|nr:hypothetical protein FDUTEX481_08496 [Tolypothrix sp. PCC 7601]
MKKVFRVLQVKKCSIVIANGAKRNEAIARAEIASLRDATRTLHSVSLAMTGFGSFIFWNTLIENFRAEI